jgi:uncharacterized protein GlcG (DUF336 family)
MLLTTLAVCLACVFATPGLAQGQRPTPPAQLISIAEVRAIIDGAVGYARGTNRRMAVAVVDPAGELLAGERMDGAAGRNFRFAEAKAYASAVYAQTTEELGDLYKTRPDRYFGILNMYGNKVYLVGGGVPLALDGKLVGAVGVAGLPQGEDEKAGRAGIAAWMKLRETMKK